MRSVSFYKTNGSNNCNEFALRDLFPYSSNALWSNENHYQSFRFPNMESWRVLVCCFVFMVILIIHRVLWSRHILKTMNITKLPSCSVLFCDFSAALIVIFPTYLERWLSLCFWINCLFIMSQAAETWLFFKTSLYAGIAYTSDRHHFKHLTYHLLC